MLYESLGINYKMERWSSDELENETYILEDDFVKCKTFWTQNRIIHTFPLYYEL